MPLNNRFQHQNYPTSPTIAPQFLTLRIAPPMSDHNKSLDTEFPALHTELGVKDVIVVHGTFMGDDSFAVGEILKSIGGTSKTFGKPLNMIANELNKRLKLVTDEVAADVGNYSTDFVDRFQELVGDDPRVERLHPTWTGQNHHLARADLAVRLLCRLADAAPEHGETVLLWGHSHAGNGFALLTNLLANDRASVGQFFAAAGDPAEPHWVRARKILASVDGPHPLANSVCIASFSAPVRYGWDTAGYRTLTHILHHRCLGGPQRTTAQPVFPFQSPPELFAATHGDWVQTFGIAGTDVTPPTSAKQNRDLAAILEGNLTPPENVLPGPLRPPKRIANVLGRWKTGTRCHADGVNLLVDYEPCGRETSLGIPIEDSLFGHGVATTVDWLPGHLNIVMETIRREFARPD